MSIKKLPLAEIYEQEFAYMPWGLLIQEGLTVVEEQVPEGASVLDIMCGPGYLLGEIAKRRTDLILEGFDHNIEFIQFAQNKYPHISFQILDVLAWNPEKKFDLILCTAGIHHVPYERQVSLLKNIAQSLNPDGLVILGDPYIDDYSNESERKQAAAKLGYEYMVASIKNGAPDEIILATMDILYNDVMGFEFKTSIQKMEPEFRKFFPHVEVKKTWPKSHTEFGDYYIVGRRQETI